MSLSRSPLAGHSGLGFHRTLVCNGGGAGVCQLHASCVLLVCVPVMFEKWRQRTALLKKGTGIRDSSRLTVSPV